MHTCAHSKHIQGSESMVKRISCISAPQLKDALKRLHRGFLLLLLSWTTGASEKRGGHFSVVALGKGKPEKFIIGLRYLTHPKFLELLDKAELEFGFGQNGVLVIPCEATELQRILSRNHK